MSLSDFNENVVDEIFAAQPLLLFFHVHAVVVSISSSIYLSFAPIPFSLILKCTHHEYSSLLVQQQLRIRRVNVPTKQNEM